MQIYKQFSSTFEYNQFFTMTEFMLKVLNKNMKHSIPPFYILYYIIRTCTCRYKIIYKYNITCYNRNICILWLSEQRKSENDGNWIVKLSWETYHHFGETNFDNIAFKSLYASAKLGTQTLLCKQISYI